MSLSPREMRALYEQTDILRRPTFGIISGYHELPYICLGQDHYRGFGSIKVSGRIHVSPRFVIRPSHLGPQYEDIFGKEHVDTEIAGRMFGFIGFPDKPVEIKSEQFQYEQTDTNIDEAVTQALDHLARHEDITTGLIVSPDARYYPVSVERFIASIIDDEFRVK